MSSPSATTPAAVFISYAREDSEAARRIADALRASAVEVWFDQNELRGGDAWDNNIRRQIRDCALFLPVISAQTQERREGYFRLEWKLAEERTSLMAEGTPFVVPVAIDDVKERDSLVPKSFLQVQWTRLPRGETSPVFVQRVAGLLAGVPPGNPAPCRVGPPGVAPVSVRQSRRWPLAALAVGTLVAAVVVWLRPWRRDAGPGSPTASHVAAKSVPPAQSEVRQLVGKAKALQDEYAMDDTLRDYLISAEQLCKRAVELDPMDGEAWAVYARVNLSLVNFDTVNSRLEAARQQVRSAMQFAPRLLETRLAQADYLRKQGEAARPEAERLLRELVVEAPNDKRVLRMMALSLVAQNKHEEALVYYDRSSAQPGGDSKALLSRANALFTLERYKESEAAVDASIALRPTSAAHLMKMRLVMWRGDLAEARAVLEKIPAAQRADDRAVYLASVLWLWLQAPEKSLAVLSATPREFFDDAVVRGPKGFFQGQAYLLSGRKAAAQAEWRAALPVIDQRLTTRPNDPRLLGWRALLLASFGERAEAERVFTLYEELGTRGAFLGSSASAMTHPVFFAAGILVQLERHEEALQRLETVVQRTRMPAYRTALRFDPLFDPLRSHPRFQALLHDPKNNAPQF